MATPPDPHSRTPDFVVVGAMKAGTTSLFQWLGEHPGTHLPAVKEPHFFSREEQWARGTDAYLELFAAAPHDLVTGEASASYADPRVARRVATRLAGVAPDVRLVYLVRDPVARLKSHYLHEYQRSRERRSFDEAVSAPGNDYVALSRYADVASVFREVLGEDRLLVVRTDELDGSAGPGWRRVTDHLGLGPRPGPEARANVSDGKVAYSPLVLRLWESGLLDRARRLPGPVRRLARRGMGSATADLRQRSAEVAGAAVPPDVAADLGEQWERVCR